MESVAAPGNLDIFSNPPTQYAISQELVSEHRPISTLSSAAPISFVITTPQDEYIQLNENLFQLKLRVDIKKKDQSDVAATDWQKIWPANNLLHSIFKQIDIEINGKNISLSPQTYGYKSLFETIVGFTQDARTSYMTAAMLYNDKKNKEAATNTKIAFLKPKTPATTGEGKEIDLMGKLHLDLAMQNKALVGGMELKITLIPHSPTFYLMADDTLVPSVTFLDASLYLNRAKVTPDILQAHTAALSKSLARYPISRNEVKSFTINSGTLSATIDNVVYGQIPRRAIIGIVSNEAFNGSLKKNPYNFKHYDINFIASYVDGVQYPSKAYTPDFDSDLYTREYLGLFQAYNQITTDSVINLDKEAWADGNTLFAFNYAQDSSDGPNISGHKNPLKRGSLRLQVRFKKALTETINVVVFLEYDNEVDLNMEREASIDYL